MPIDRNLLFLSPIIHPSVVMSGENIYNLVGVAQVPPQAEVTVSAYNGKYEKRLGERKKPTYSTFYEKGKEYDGTHARFFKQRDAIIGKSVADSVYPENYLKKGNGVQHIVPQIHKEKIFTKPPVDHGAIAHSSPFGANAADGSNQGARGDHGELKDTGANGNTGTDVHPSGDVGDHICAIGAMDGNYSGRAGPPFSGKKNFIASNIVEMSNMVPKRRVDQPSYATNRKDFGKAPAYLTRVKGELEAEKNFVKAIGATKAARQQQAYSQYVYLLDPKKKEELEGKLRQRLEEKLSVMRKLSLTTHGAVALKKRGDLEKTIRDLEVALQKLNKKAIFIYKDDPVNGQWCKNAALEEARAYAQSN